MASTKQIVEAPVAKYDELVEESVAEEEKVDGENAQSVEEVKASSVMTLFVPFPQSSLTLVEEIVSFAVSSSPVEEANSKSLNTEADETTISTDEIFDTLSLVVFAFSHLCLACGE